MIHLVDYGMGNLRSIGKAFEHLGQKVNYISSPRDFKKIDILVLPGVGSFGKAVDNLKKKKMFDCVKEWILERKRPFLGICLGLHFLFRGSQESPGKKGMAFFKREITRFRKGLIVPHMGWNRVFFNKKTSLFRDIAQGSFFYFCHSYYAPCGGYTSGYTFYGTKFSSVIEKDNLVLVQFHPEKSQKLGLKLLKNFIKR